MIIYLKTFLKAPFETNDHIIITNLDKSLGFVKSYLYEKEK